MNTDDGRTRAVYVKFNNAVQELIRVRSTQSGTLDGGPEAYVENFLRNTDPNPVLIISFHRSPNKDEYLEDGRIKAMSYHWAPGLSVRSLVSRIVGTLKMTAQLIQFRPTQILCAYGSFPLWVCYLVARLYSIPLVCSRHTRIQSDADPIYRRFDRAVDRWVFRRATGVLCHGPYLKKLMLDINVPPDKVFEFNWAFKHMNVSRVTETRETSRRGLPGANSLLYIGRIERNKGVFDLLEACAVRLRRDRGLRLVYAGTGTDLENLETAIAEHDLASQVVCLGRVPHEALAELISCSRMVITPTRSAFPEGRCMAAMEGLIMGKPVIAPDFGPFPYLVEHECNGLLFKADCVADLATKIARALDDHELYERMCAGAANTRSKLREPPVTFREAMKRAFEIVEN